MFSCRPVKTIIDMGEGHWHQDGGVSLSPSLGWVNAEARCGELTPRGEWGNIPVTGVREIIFRDPQQKTPGPSSLQEVGKRG